MALQFIETAPGVHTTSIVNPRSGRRYNIAIIESSNAWQLFIDGELAVRDLPSFKAAAAQAQAKASAPRTSNMVRAACILVMLSVAGASAVGMSKLVGPMLEAEATVSAVAAETETTAVPHRFKRVKPKAAESQSKIMESRLKPSQPVSVEDVVVTVHEPPKSTAPSAPAAAPVPAPEAVVTTVPEAPAASQLPATPIAPEAEAASAPPTAEPVDVAPKAEAKPPKKDETAELRAAPIIGLKPILPSTNKRQSPRIVAKVDAPPAIVIARKPAVKPPEPSSDADFLEDASEQQPQAATMVPPPPVKAPRRTAAPLIRSSEAEIAKRLNSLLAEIEQEEAKVTDAPEAAPVARPRQSAKKANARRKPRPVAKTLRRKDKRRVRRTARAYQRAPEPRMVCYGHVCRLQ